MSATIIAQGRPPLNIIQWNLEKIRILFQLRRNGFMHLMAEHGDNLPSHVPEVKGILGLKHIVTICEGHRYSTQKKPIRHFAKPRVDWEHGFHSKAQRAGKGQTFVGTLYFLLHRTCYIWLVRRG